MAPIITKVTWGHEVAAADQRKGAGSCLAELEDSDDNVAVLEAEVGYLHQPNSFGVSVISTPFLPSISTSSSIRTPSFPLM